MQAFLARRSRAAVPAAHATSTTTPPSDVAANPPRLHNGFDPDAERQAAVEAAREAFLPTRLAAAAKNRALAERLKGKLILAPLTRGGNLPFRQLCADFGCEAAVSEMVFARSLVGRNGGGKGAQKAEKTRLRRAANEPLFGVQIATNNIAEGVAAARLAQEAGASFLSLNVGCPIYEATRRGLGAAMLRKPTKLARLVAGLVAETDLPVEVKIRTGPGESNINAGFVAALMEAAGAAVVTIHGRTMEQRYRKAADWDLIREVARQRRADGAAAHAAAQSPDAAALLPPTIPIVGNGDVLTFYEAERRGVFLGGGGPDEQDADAGLVHAVMVGRGALVKPWLWTEARERRELALTAEERVGVYRQLVAHMKTYFGADEMGKRKAFYFLPWHFQFFHRVRPMPRDEYESISLKQPLLSTRVTLWDKGREDEGADGLPWLERILRSENEKAYEEIAAALWDSASDGEAAAALERLARERCRDWEREVYEKEQAEEAEGGRGRGRGRGRAGAEGEEGEGLEGLQHDDGDGVEG